MNDSIIYNKWYIHKNNLSIYNIQYNHLINSHYAYTYKTTTHNNL